MKKIITYGTFDMFHQGHLNLLKKARKLGDYLIVGVTSENYDKYRGKLNVKQSVLERIENVKKTGLADKIIIEEYEGQKIDDIIKMKVDIFTVGSDWIGRFDYLKDFCEVVYLERTKGISSTEMRNQNHPYIRFGIVGCGRIANRFVAESKFVSGCSVEGVFGIHQESIQKFQQNYQLSFSTDDYDSFLHKVNAVYIASPHETHFEYAKRALESGKHVLCEKPMCLTQKEVKNLYLLSRKKEVVLMEALKTAYCPGFQRMISCAKSGKIGEIKQIDATFTKLVPNHSRELQENGVGGSVTELASYPLLAILKLLGPDFKDIHFISYQHKGHIVDLFTQIDLIYSNATATAKIGLGVKSEGDLTISGTRGYVYVPAPWWKTDYFELRYEDTNENEKNFYKFSGDGLRYEIVEFINQISAGDLSQDHWISEKIAEIIELYRSGWQKTIIS